MGNTRNGVKEGVTKMGRGAIAFGGSLWVERITFPDWPEGIGSMKFS